MPYPLKREVLRLLGDGVSRVRRTFDATSGKFLAPNGGWAVTNQDIILPLAMLVATRHAANPFQGDPALLELACRGGDALRAAQDEQGHFEFIKTDGSRWGKIYMPWTLVHWIETYRTLRPLLDAARAQAWETGLRAAFTGLSGIVADSLAVHNIPAWQALGLFRAGQSFGVPDWEQLGRAYLHRTAAAQNPAGFWPEGGGPTTAYNLVYVHALGLYHGFSGDAAVLPALERAVTFHRLFTYPDGSNVETIDGRVKYHDAPGFSGCAGFMVNEEGRDLLRRLLTHAGNTGKQDGHLPHLASILPFCPEEIESPVSPKAAPDFARVHGDRAAVRKAGPWYACMSAYVVDTADLPGVYFARFRMERQNLISLFHEKTGLLIGGGNSKLDPSFSTFQQLAGRRLITQPDEARVSCEDDRTILNLLYGEQPCRATLRLLDAARAELTFEALPSASSAAVTAGFTMRLKTGTELCASGAESPCRIDARLNWRYSLASPQRQACWVAGESWKLALPEGAEFIWPVYPFNPYAIDGAAPPEQAVARVETTLTPGGPAKTFLLEITV